MPKYLLLFPLLLAVVVCFIPGMPGFVLGAAIGCYVMRLFGGNSPENVLGNNRGLAVASFLGVLALISIALGNG